MVAPPGDDVGITGDMGGIDRALGGGVVSPYDFVSERRMSSGERCTPELTSLCTRDSVLCMQL